MRTFRIASLVAVGAISLPLLTSSTSAVAASPRTVPRIGTQLAILKGSDTTDIHNLGFGSSVAVSGTTAVVGAPLSPNGAGEAYVFTETAGVWKQTAVLAGSDTVTDDQFGHSVAVSGTTAVVGAPIHANVAGRAYVFTRTTAGWKQAAELKGSGTIAGEAFGESVAISGTTVVVGASGHAKNAGRAYVFTETSGVWKQTAVLKGSDTAAYDEFGRSVAISGTTAVVGGEGHADVAGRAYVFTRTANGWKQAAELEGSDTAAVDAFGYSVAISGSNIVVGTPGHLKDAGRAYVFTKTSTGWKQAAELRGSDTVADDFFGESVAISGASVVVGSSHSSTGAAYVFTKTAAGWKEVAEMKDPAAAALNEVDEFGASVAISGATIVVGACYDVICHGGAYVFDRTATGWKWAAELNGSDTVTGGSSGDGDWFGASVAISGTTAVVGAPLHAGAAGRAYVFEA